MVEVGKAATVGRHPLQRSGHFVEGLRSRPWWNVDELAIAGVLEANFSGIQQEFFNLVLCGRLKLHPQSLGGPRKEIADGDWNLFEVSSFGEINARNAVEVPFTANVMKALAETDTPASGLSYFSVLQPNVHIAPHCGPTNTRIRSHLGLRIPDGAALRVGHETRAWEEGKCLVFDDSFEHEAFNRSELPRALLLVDTWHPDLTAEQRVELIRRRNQKDANRVLQREGWQRNPGPDSGPEPVVVGAAMAEGVRALTALTSERLVSLKRTAKKFANQDGGFFAHASVLVLAGPSAFGPDLRLGWARELCESGLFAVDVWAALRDLLRNHVTDPLSDVDVGNLIHIGSLFWRCDPSNAGSMNAFLNAWPAADKAELLRRLVRHDTIGDMVDDLVAPHSADDSPPFGAAAPLVVVATYERARSRQQAMVAPRAALAPAQQRSTRARS